MLAYPTMLPRHISPIQPSPKRKRDPPPYLSLLNTAQHTASTPPRGSPVPSGSDSPRNVVADQLQSMSIQAIPFSPLTPTDDVVHKKPKLEMMAMDGGGNSPEDCQPSDLQALQGHADDTSVIKDINAENTKEIVDSPHSHSRPLPSQPRFLAHLASFAPPIASTSSTSPKSSPPLRILTETAKSKIRVAQPRPRKKSPSPPLSTLTWQDSEITGHLVDLRTDPDDDGTGLNGIGFKPTPAMAHARAQRRRQQLTEWRAREAREARAKRSERRRRGVGFSVNSRESTVEREAPTSSPVVEANSIKRVVRFSV